MIKKIVIVLAIILWPLNIILNFEKLHFSFNSVFKNDYQGEQLVLRNIHLYPNIITARIFQNKPKIYLNKYVSNFFVLTDPNNYFFALHPEPLAGRVNLSKFPFMSIVFFLLGIYYFQKSKFKYLILLLVIPILAILSAFTNFEGLDFILWVPISLLIVNGVNMFKDKNTKLFNYFSILFILFTAPEIIRSFFNI